MEFKRINDFPNYSISKCGKVFSHNINDYMKLRINKSGYYSVKLRNPTGHINKTIHRLVMLNFNYIEGCENLYVNHKDGDKFNNNLDNLEWCTPYENSLHADTLQLNSEKRTRRLVKLYTVDGIYIDSYISTMDAHRCTGIPQIKISQMCRGIYKEWQGYVCRYLEEPFSKYPVRQTRYMH